MRGHMLTIELVPQTCWYANVRSEVSRAEWEVCKQFVRRRSGDRCEVCGGRGAKWPVECHEVWSYDEDQLVQHLDGLVALCPRCHEVKHIGRAEAVGRLLPALEHLAKVNGWTLEEARAYAVRAFAIWRARSEVEWDLDVSWLATIGVSVPDATNARSQQPPGEWEPA